ncbi:hypothetical protein QJS04_geneDACA024205 [Acorus gramineus]|uniref:Methyltransferase type 11 domain-containing protein n=1 Tax=Acorus gramineus TaxID=55184 RepID=A0AAV9A092_ACOGR|nr:hypothetical protein QJS04_geneDACA024205 [Acorus gramineus]
MATYTLSKPQPLLLTSSSSTSIGGRKKKKSVVHVSATVNASVASPANEEGRLERPRWAGETPLSRLVGTLISFKPLYSLMKLGARRVLISTAEKSNVPWREMTRQILESDVYQELETVLNPSVVYPDYYLKPFHAYDEGNLSWLAAAEAEAATISIAIRAIPTASSIDEATQAVRGTWLNTVEQYHLQYSGNSAVHDILDIGCSVGVSTRFLSDKFPLANITGLDLSPYFLSVAKYNERRKPMNKPVRWIHANGEDTGLPSNSFDLVSLSYLFHELPAQATVNMVKEVFRLLRPGGTMAVTDNSPKSKVLQELPPVLFTLMKSTEPFLDEYYLLDLEGAMREAGFVNVISVLTDPRHRTVTGMVPL